jgi:hypothetical protein
MISRRSLFLGSAAIILTPGVLMPVRKVWVPEPPAKEMFSGIIYVGEATADGRVASWSPIKVEITMSDLCGRRGFVPGDLRPTRVAMNERWMRNIS